ncbi:hypothetical protein PSAB6_50194 [Paraburkholderia sabiae]|nr:hypothetical protein PSAB6_50194 [Paraburkholderia sabiae]
MRFSTMIVVRATAGLVRDGLQQTNSNALRQLNWSDGIPVDAIDAHCVDGYVVAARCPCEASGIEDRISATTITSSSAPFPLAILSSSSFLAG